MSTTEDIQQTSDWSFAKLTTAETQYLTHGYHRYPAKFIPQLVRKLLDEYTEPGDRVCDPFGGCGTTLVEAKLANRASFGFDINPVAVFITRTKITGVSPKILSERFEYLCDKLNKGPAALPEIGGIANVERLLYWFGETNLIQLSWIFSQIRKEEDPAIRRFFLCALSNVLKNCSYWLTTSTKPQKDPDKIPELPVKAFISQISRMVKRNSSFVDEINNLKSREPLALMRRADARHLPLPEDCIDFVVTSPPYSTSYEYPDIHQLTALLFGFCKSITDLRQGFIGCKSGDLHRDELLTNRKAARAVKDLKASDKRLGDAVQSYFLDMSHVYFEMCRILRKGGKACIVIGDTELRGVTVPNSKVAIDQMSKAGFKLERNIDRLVPGRVLAPYRDTKDGRFTSADNPDAKKVYSHEYVLIFRKK